MPTLKLEEWIVIQTQPHGQVLTGDSLVERAAKSHAVDGYRLYSKADDSTVELVHDDQHPMRLEQNRLRAEQVQAPEAVLGMAQEGEPGRPTVRPAWAIVPGQHTTDYILIDFQTKGLGQVLGDPGAAKAGIAAFELADRLDQILSRSVWPPACAGDGRSRGTGI